ncbi:hypothetical protein C0Q70_12110 [Pomacea canaliculata]|uniref:Ig-like domain-containing protein n=1 Tax=Pomacea canaliculata TaxID=400727 RepID=A0A2T7P0L5_POMCA|nr:hypothetical protein C0Q70_12110 [Pomacea canaliculata]
MIPLNVFRGTFTIVVLLIACVPANCDSSVKCHTPEATLSKEASLTCYFPEDISVSKKDFTVYHYVKHGLPDSVVDCFWVRGTLQCLVRDGFKFDKVVTDHMTVQIPHAVEKHSGKYTCQMSGNAASDIAPCHLHLKKDTTVKCHISKEQTLFCHFPEDISQTKKNFTVHRHADHHDPGLPPNKSSERINDHPIFSGHSSGGDPWSMQKAILLVILVFHIYLVQELILVHQQTRTEIALGDKTLGLIKAKEARFDPRCFGS